MPQLLSDAVVELSTWVIGPPKTKNGQMSISSITANDRWPSLQLPKDRMGEVTTPFEPSVFRGTGEEPRKGIAFSVPPDVLEELRAIENWAKASFKDATWHPALKEAGGYPGTVKAKINTVGPNACQVVDAEGCAMPWPADWTRLPMIPILEVRGVYSQKTGSGLIIDVTHLMIGELSRTKEPCSFL